MLRYLRPSGRICLWLCIMGIILIGVHSGQAWGADQVGLYDIWEIEVGNSTGYSNPFDFEEIELQATFSSPTGRQISFFGFFDGDGQGGQSGDVWKLRFMPDELGAWTYTYTWTDGTPGGSGDFEAVDTGLSGPLQEDENRSWFLMTARGEPFHVRGYSLGWTPRFAPSRNILNEVDWIKNAIQTYMINDGYNFTDWGGLINRGQIGDEYNNWIQSWWLNTYDTKTFDVAAWAAYEEVLGYLRDHGIYATSYAAFIYQSQRYGFNDFKVFLRYYVARLAPYSNLIGCGASWEWPEIWSEGEVTQIMQYVHDIDPWKRLLGVHDSMRASFSSWGGISLRQRQARNVFDGNSRTAGLGGGVQPPFDDKPIVASEDLWERPSGASGQPRNATEIRRGAWGVQMAGILTMYSEWNDSQKQVVPGSGQGEPEVRRMFDFFYTKTRYRQYEQLNGLVSSSARQICSGIPGTEYLVYDEDGGSITIDLSAASSSDLFSVAWFDPTDGAQQSGGYVNGGAPRTVSSPYSHDTVLLLGGAPPDSTPPTVPQDLDADPQSEHRIDLDWQAADDPESGIQHYIIYRDGAQVGQAGGTEYSDMNLEESTNYSYEVSAVNGSGLESDKSQPASATTHGDMVPPVIASVRAVGANQVDVEFSEPVEEASAEDESNYSIDQGISVLAAQLDGDLLTVHLSTSEHAEGITYIVTVNAVRDRAASPNTIAPNSMASYQLSLDLEVTNLNKTNYQTAMLEEGDAHYIDRSYTLVDIPAAYEGLLWIKTANDDKTNTSEEFLTFQVNQDVTAYVCYDHQVSVPDWITGHYVDTGDDILVSDLGAGTEMEIWSRDLPAGQVAMGGNMATGGSGAELMYLVILQGRGGAVEDTTPPLISQVSAGDISDTAAVVQWSTDEASDSQVEYGWTMAYGSTTPLDPAMITQHSVVLSGLSPGILYHYRVRSADGSGNAAHSEDQTFQTGNTDTTPPQISAITVSAVSESSATVSWSTDEPADSRVEYGLAADDYEWSMEDAALATSHGFNLPELVSNTRYHFIVRSQDEHNNTAVSADSTFTTELEAPGQPGAPEHHDD